MASNGNLPGSVQVDGEMLSINDPEELSQRKRINQILGRREDVINARNEAVEAYLAGDLSKQQALMVYQARIESLIADLWTKMQDSETGQEILYESEIAVVTVHPPADVLPDDDHDFAAGADMPEPKTVSIYGLKWFIENQPIVAAPFTVSTWNPPREQTVTGQEVLDFGVLDEALLKLMEFIDESGIDADFEDDTEDAGFDYSDLLDDGGDDPE